MEPGSACVRGAWRRGGGVGWRPYAPAYCPHADPVGCIVPRSPPGAASKGKQQSGGAREGTGRETSESLACATHPTQVSRAASSAHSAHPTRSIRTKSRPRAHSTRSHGAAQRGCATGHRGAGDEPDRAGAREAARRVPAHGRLLPGGRRGHVRREHPQPGALRGARGACARAAGVGGGASARRARVHTHTLLRGAQPAAPVVIPLPPPPPPRPLCARSARRTRSAR